MTPQGHHHLSGSSRSKTPVLKSAGVSEEEQVFFTKDDNETKEQI